MPFNQANNGNIEYNSYTQDFEKEVDKMNLLFWNLAKNSNEKHIKNILTEHNIDIAVFGDKTKSRMLKSKDYRAFVDAVCGFELAQDYDILYFGSDKLSTSAIMKDISQGIVLYERG